MAAVLLAVALLATGTRAQSTADDRTIDLRGFLATLDTLARTSRAAETPAQAEALIRDLPPSWTVRDGTARFTVSSRPIAAALRAGSGGTRTWSDTRALAVARIEAMRDEAALLTTGGVAPPAHLRAALQEVLSAPEFRGRQRYAGLMALVDRFRRWLRTWLPSIAGGKAAAAPILQWFTWIVAVLAFSLLAGLVWRLLRRATRESSIRVRAARRVQAEDARTWAARARAAAAAGDAREAVRCAYHAVLHRLDEDGAWRIAEDRTPREYLRLLPAADVRQPAVAFVARLFEGTWYGGAEPGLDQARDAVRHLGELGCDAQADPAI